jgi:hypothetical protein
VIRLDLEKDRDILTLFSSFSEKDRNGREILGNITDFFPDQPDLKIREGSFTLKDGEKTGRIQNVDMLVRGKDGEISLEGKFDAGLNYAGPFERSFGVSTGVGINGVFSADQQEGRAEIVLSSLSVTEHLPADGPADPAKILVEVHPVSAVFIFKDRTVSLHSSGETHREMPGETPYDYYFNYNTETGDTSGAINCRNFPLIELVSFSSEWENANQLLAQAVTGSASFEYESGGIFHYSVDFNGKSKPGDSFVIRANGSEKFITVDEFRFTAAPFATGANLFQGNFYFSGDMGLEYFTPSGTIVFERFSFTGDEKIDAVLKLSSHGKEITVSGETVTMGQTVFDVLDMRLFPSEDDLEFTLSGLCENGGILSMDAVLNYQPRHLEATLSMDSLSFLDLAGMIRPFAGNITIPSVSRGFLQNTLIAAEVFFTTDFNHVMYNAPNASFFYRTENDETGVAGSISLSGTEVQFTLSEGVFSIAEKDFHFQAQADFPDPQHLLFSVNANHQDMSWRLDGQVLDKTTLTISSSSGLHVNGSVSNSGAVSGYLEGFEFPVLFGNQSAYLNFYITLRYDSRDLWALNIAHFQARDFSAPDRDDLLRISGAANQDGANFSELQYSDRINTLRGGADFSWAKDFSTVRLTINMSEGQETPEIRGSGNYREYFFVEGLLEKEHVELRAAVSDMRLDRFVRESSMALVNGEAAIVWNSLDSFQAEINLTSLYAQLQESVIQASAAAHLSNDDFLISDLRLSYAGLEAFMPVLKLSRIESMARVGADIQGFIFGKRLEGKIELDANFKPIGSWMEIKQALNSIDGSFRTANLQYGSFDLREPSVFIFSRDNGAFSVSGGPKNMLRMEMDRDGNFFAGLSAPFPVRSSVVGRLKDGYLDARCSGLFVDLPVIWALLPPVSGFSIDGGYVTANVDIRGPVKNPEFSGSARGSSLRMRVPDYVSQDIRPVPFNIAIEGNEMSFGPVTALVGNGRGTITGVFSFEGWIPNNIGLEISIPRESPIPYQFDISGFLAQGEASGKLVINLDDSVLDIKGDLFANNAETGLNTDEITQGRGEPPGNRKPVIVNITVTSGPSVEFIWPVAYPVLRANPEMGTVVRVSVDTLSGQFSLNSDVKIRSGELFYFERTFYIRQGNLVFRESERQFSPLISARAEIRDRTDSGPVTISMLIENEPLLNFVPRFEANPGLTQIEIYSLLGQNPGIVQGNDSTDAAQRIFLSSTTNLLGSFIDIRRIEKQIRNFLRLDMFSVRTQILQIAVLNMTGGLGQTPVDSNSRVGNYFDNTSVYGGKYISQDMFIQGMLSTRYDENRPDFGGLRFEWDIGIELQSPLFNIRWDFFPYHPENWWVNDNSITLSRSWSF